MSSSHGGGRLAFRRNRPTRIQQKSDNLNYVPDPVQLSSHHSQNVANQKVHFTTLNTNINKNSRRRLKNAWGKNSPSSIPKNASSIEYSNIASNTIKPSLPPINHQNGLISKQPTPHKNHPSSSISTSDTMTSNSSWLRFVREEDDNQPSTHMFTSDVRNSDIFNEYQVQGYYHRNGNEQSLINDDDQYQRYTHQPLDIDPNSFNRHEQKYENKPTSTRNRSIRKWEIKIRERENSAWFNIKRFASDIPHMLNFTPEFKPYRRISYKKYASMIEHRSHESDDQLRHFHLDRINYTRKHSDDWMTHLYDIQQSSTMILHPSQVQLQNISSTVTATAPVLPPHLTNINNNNSVLLLQQQQLQERIRLQEEHQRVWTLKQKQQQKVIGSTAVVPPKTIIEDDDQRQASVSQKPMTDVPQFIKQQWAISNQSSTSPYSQVQPQTNPFINKMIDNQSMQQQALLQAMQMRQIQKQQTLLLAAGVSKVQVQVQGKSATVFNQQLFQNEQHRRHIQQQQIQQQISFQAQPTVFNGGGGGGGGSNAAVVKTGVVTQMNSNGTWNTMQQWNGPQSGTPQPGGYGDGVNAYAQDIMNASGWRSSFSNSNQSGQNSVGQFYGNGNAWQGEPWNQFM